MLIEFTVGNFRSFKEPETFSMVAASLTSPDPKLDTENVIPVDKGLELLTSAALYGRNSSGKSNLLAALGFMREIVLNSSKDTQATDAIPTEQFRLSTETREQPSLFEVAFIAAGQRYRYGFEVDTRRVVSEWLFTVPTIREATLFQREGEEINVPSRFKEGRGLQERTRPNALFLSVVAQFNGSIATRIINWMRDLTIFGLNDWTFTYSLDIMEFAGLRDQVVELVRKLDMDIDGIDVDEDKINPWYPLNSDKGRPHLHQWKEPDNWRAVTASHKVYNGHNDVVSTESFNFAEHESEGSRKIFAMAGPLVLALERGYTFCIDEIDIKLHPLLTRALISLFNSKETNPKGAQLIFTTHDANLLDNRLLRRDQIWFVEKDRYGASHLVSLAEYRVRKEASFEKDYLQGRYGGIPSLGDLSHLFEDAHA